MYSILYILCAWVLDSGNVCCVFECAYEMTPHLWLYVIYMDYVCWTNRTWHLIWFAQLNRTQGARAPYSRLYRLYVVRDGFLGKNHFIPKRARIKRRARVLAPQLHNKRDLRESFITHHACTHAWRVSIYMSLSLFFLLYLYINESFWVCRKRVAYMAPIHIYDRICAHIVYAHAVTHGSHVWIWGMSNEPSLAVQ